MLFDVMCQPVPSTPHNRYREEQQEAPQARLASIARLFPWHGRQKLAAERLWHTASRPPFYSRDDEAAARDQRMRKYVLRLSQALICQEIYHQPF